MTESPAGMRVRRLSWRLVADLLAWVALVIAGLLIEGDMRDAMAYYNASLDDIYSSSTFLSTGYVYSPAFAVLVEPFRWVGPEVLLNTIRIGSTLALGYLVTPWLGIALILAQFPGLRPELGVGNLDLVTAAILVWVLRKPWLWPTLLLTKVTPGIGLVWHLVRREWGALRTAAIATLAVVLISLPFTGLAWIEWVGVLTGDNIAIADEHTETALWIRGLIGLAITVYAARSDRAWLIPIAVAVTFPNPNIAHWLVVLAIPRLWRASPASAGLP